MVCGLTPNSQVTLAASLPTNYTQSTPVPPPYPPPLSSSDNYPPGGRGFTLSPSRGRQQRQEDTVEKKINSPFKS